MPGLVPGIHVLSLIEGKNVDGRDEPGHDDGKLQRVSHAVIARSERDEAIQLSYPLPRWIASSQDAPRNDEADSPPTPPHSHRAARSFFSLPREAWGGTRTQLRDLAA